MKGLIPIQETNGKRAVNARDLHAFLESKRGFSNWIKDRIDKYDFVEGQDYQILYFDYQGNLLNIRHNKIGESENQQVSKIEYALSVDMAKELSMVEGNEKGKQARRYFIACEKAAQKKLESQPLKREPSLTTKVRASIEWVKGVSEILNLNESSRLSLLGKVAAPLELPTPDYLESKGVTHSATYLLKERNTRISVLVFNQKMIAAGYLEEKSRPSKSKGFSRFKCLTDKGLEYGENKVSPKNAFETQPHYYDAKFGDLLEKLLIKIDK